MYFSFYISSNFFIYFDVPPVEIDKILDKCNRDIDIVRLQIYKHEPIKKERKCTFHEEMLPPPYRYDL